MAERHMGWLRIEASALVVALQLPADTRVLGVSMPYPGSLVIDIWVEHPCLPLITAESEAMRFEPELMKLAGD